MLDFSKHQAKRIFLESTNQQLGHFFGMFIGTGIGVAVLTHVDETMSILGYKPGFIEKGLVVPLIAGTCANLMSNLGSGVDVLTNKTTFFQAAHKVGTSVYNKCFSTEVVELPKADEESNSLSK